MMPFSVLRIWGTGILSWAILIWAAYCFYEWHRRSDAANAERRHVVNEAPRRIDRGDTELNGRTQRFTTEHEEDPDAWKYLAGGIGLLALSTCGFLPALLVFGKPGGAASNPGRPTNYFTIARADGTELNVEVYGSSNLPTVICVHGWSMDRTAWYYVVRAMRNRCRVIAWDLPGLGESRGPNNGDYSLEKMAGDLAAVLEKCDGSVVLVGHSIGGMIIQTFCRLFPGELGSRVEGLVLEQTTYTNPLNTALGSSFWKAIEKPILVPLNKLTIWLAPMAWLSNWQSYFNGSLHIMTRIASLSGRQTWAQLNHGALLQARAWPGVVSRGNLAMAKFDEQQTLPRINIPVLVVAGENDRMTLPIASERIERLLGNAVPASLKAGHLGLFEQAETLADFIAEFAQRCLTPNRQAGGSEMDGARQNAKSAREAIIRPGGV